MLELRLFGTGSASYNGQALIGFPHQQAALLLCYLLLNKHSHHRERLSAVFWQDVPAHISRKHLSQSLWRLRHMLQVADAPVDAYLLIDKERIIFNANSHYWLDIELFEKIISRYKDIPGYKLTSEQAAELEDSIALYTGDLLDGVYEDWCLFNRERLNLLYLEALGKLMVYHEHNKTYEQGLTYGERILNCDNTRERVHQQMMRLYWLSGQRNAALAQYKQCVQILRDELDVAPMQETTRLYEQMLHNHFEPATKLGYYQDSALFPLTQMDEALQKLAGISLQKLTRLQTIINETSAELQQLERLIRKTLLDS